MTDYATEKAGNINSPALAGRFRLILGLTMMIAGLYVGLFTAQPGRGLGLLSFIASPFVFLTDKKRAFSIEQLGGTLSDKYVGKKSVAANVGY